MAELRVVSTLALQRAFEQLAPEFTRQTGVTMRAEFKATAALVKEIREGAHADVAILTAEACAELDAERILSGSTLLVRSYIGVAVKAGAPHPDISTADAFIKTLLNARSLAYSRMGASGIYIKGLLERLGIAEQVNARATVVPSGFTAALAARGEVELALQQVSELLSVEGIELVGRLPEGVQETSLFSAGAFTDSQQPQAARDLVAFMHSQQAVPILERCGLEPIRDAG